MARIAELYGRVRGVGLLDGVDPIPGKNRPQAAGPHALLPDLAIEVPAVQLVGEALGDPSAEVVLFVPDGARSGELGPPGAQELERDLLGAVPGFVGAPFVRFLAAFSSHDAAPTRTSESPARTVTPSTPTRTTKASPAHASSPSPSSGAAVSSAVRSEVVGAPSEPTASGFACFGAPPAQPAANAAEARIMANVITARAFATLAS